MTPAMEEMPAKRSRRWILRAGLAAGVGGVGCLGWATMIEPHWLDITRRDMVLDGLPGWWHGKTIALLSDLHLGPRVSDDWLADVFARVSAMAPDVVMVTGDFIDLEDGVLGHATRVLADLPMGKTATLAVLGNHDYGHNWSEPELADGLVDILRGGGVEVLRNRWMDLGGLPVLGCDDLWSGNCRLGEAMRGWPAGRAGVAMAHNPDTADFQGWRDFQGWILSGHTHGGQCRLPFLPPPLLPVKNRRYVAGAYGLEGGRNLYISRGVGHLTRVRFNVRPEATVFRLASS